jgi:hypothetical protein
MIVSVGAISLTLVQCSSSSSSGGPLNLDGGQDGSTATTGGSGGSAGTSGTGATTTTGTGGSGTGGAGGGTGQCAPAATDDMCTTCLKGKCCNELGTCSADPDCLALLQCVGACADQTCVGNCISMHPSGTNSVMPVINCQNMNCMTECM